MTSRLVRLRATDSAVRNGLAAIRGELLIPDDFPAEVLAEAHRAATTAAPESDRIDERAIEFVTIDPASSLDLDQAVAVASRGDGYRVHYAIADVAAFAVPGGAVDTEARRRGLTLYAPDGKVPLHPMVLSEDAASLLPDVDRPAAVWRIDLDAAGAVTDATVYRAVVRSRAKLSYEDVQAQLDAADAGEVADRQLLLLREVGRLRQEQERRRGGIDLPVPEQVVTESDGEWGLTFRAPLPIEQWNAQISLLTGMVAADMMLSGGVGILRTMPPPLDIDLRRVRRTAAALGLRWPTSGSYAELIRSADPDQPAHLAFLSLATTLLRGAGYTAFVDTEPELREHAAVAAPYAHVTAPLRRLVDRFGTEVALAVAAGRPVPEWVRAALPELPDQMVAATRLSRSLERESINLIEAVLLADRVGERFAAEVVDRDPRRAESFQIVIRDPGVRAKASGPFDLGQATDVELSVADPLRREVLFRGPVSTDGTAAEAGSGPAR